MTRLTVKPRPATHRCTRETARGALRHRPFNLVRRLRDEETLGVGHDLGPPRVDGDLGVGAFRALDLDGQEEEFELGEAQPGERSDF